MLDIHSHILPKMDDGSKSVEMSLEMLRSSCAQGVTTLVSTSHFYADQEDPDRFLRRRRHAIEKLRPEIAALDLKLYYGAEVLYYPGISQSKEIRALAIEGTSLILIEMPFEPWSEKIYDELISFQYNSNLQIVLAHIERYRSLQSRRIYEMLFDQPFLFQMNAEAFTSFSSRRLALKLIDRGKLHFLGTDCHNTTTRPPNMDEAKKVIEKKLSPDTWRDLAAGMEERFNDHILQP